MAVRDELINLEEYGWRALSTDAPAAAAFYRQVLDDTVVMLLPGGLVLSGREAVIDSMNGEPWSSFRLDNVRVLCPTDDVAVVVYEAVARREGTPEYSALFSSHYVRREDGWKLFFHQQTPRPIPPTR